MLLFYIHFYQFSFINSIIYDYRTYFIVQTTKIIRVYTISFTERFFWEVFFANLSSGEGADGYVKWIYKGDGKPDEAYEWYHTDAPSGTKQFYAGNMTEADNIPTEEFFNSDDAVKLWDNN
ncbi:MAG: hypothetical protein K9L56_13035 [Clostridiales bacterium]|nr:hypothetical protein [Clostridiales bacterium]